MICRTSRRPSLARRAAAPSPRHPRRSVTVASSPGRSRGRQTESARTSKTAADLGRRGVSAGSRFGPKPGWSGFLNRVPQVRILPGALAFPHFSRLAGRRPAPMMAACLAARRRGHGFCGLPRGLARRARARQTPWHLVDAPPPLRPAVLLSPEPQQPRRSRPRAAWRGGKYYAPRSCPPRARPAAPRAEWSSTRRPGRHTS